MQWQVLALQSRLVRVILLALLFASAPAVEGVATVFRHAGGRDVFHGQKSNGTLALDAVVRELPMTSATNKSAILAVGEFASSPSVWSAARGNLFLFWRLTSDTSQHTISGNFVLGFLVGAAICGLVPLCFICAISSASSKVEKAVREASGNLLLGVRVEMGDLSVDLSEGIVVVHSITVHNPNGYASPYLLKVRKVHVDLDPWVLLRSGLCNIKVRRVLLRGVDVVYDKSPRSSNLNDLIAYTAGDQDPEADPEEELGPESIAWIDADGDACELNIADGVLIWSSRERGRHSVNSLAVTKLGGSLDEELQVVGPLGPSRIVEPAPGPEQAVLLKQLSLMARAAGVCVSHTGFSKSLRSVVKTETRQQKWTAGRLPSAAAAAAAAILPRRLGMDSTKPAARTQTAPRPRATHRTTLQALHVEDVSVRMASDILRPGGRGGLAGLRAVPDLRCDEFGSVLGESRPRAAAAAVLKAVLRAVIASLVAGRTPKQAPSPSRTSPRPPSEAGNRPLGSPKGNTTSEETARPPPPALPSSRSSEETAKS